MVQSASSSSQSSLSFFCGVDLERCGRVGAHANVRGEVDDFEVFVEHVKPLSADEDFGVSGRKLDLAVSMARKS